MIKSWAWSAVVLAASAPTTQAAARPDLQVVRAWTRPTVPGAPSAVGYFDLINRGSRPDRLLGAATPAAARVEIHRTTTAGGVTRMREVEGGVAVAPGATVSFAPNGWHLMLVAPKRAFRAGERVPVTLRFERAGHLAVTFEVRATAAGGGGPAMSMPMR